MDGLVLRWLVDRNSEAIGAELDAVAQAIASKAVEMTRDLGTFFEHSTTG